MPDGTRLPYRAWLPDGRSLGRGAGAARHERQPRRLGVSRRPTFAAAGIAVFAPDQRGFGATGGRGYWPGTTGAGGRRAGDGAAAAPALSAARLILMGESMGAAVLMCLATAPDPPPVDGYVLVAPAVWGRAEMNVFLRVGLWLFANLMPGLELTGRGREDGCERQPRGDQAAVAATR